MIPMSLTAQLIAAAIVQAEIAGGRLTLQYQHLHVDPGALAHLQQVVAALIVAHRSQKPGVGAWARQVLGDVAPYPAGGGAYPPGLEPPMRRLS